MPAQSLQDARARRGAILAALALAGCGNATNPGGGGFGDKDTRNDPAALIAILANVSTPESSRIAADRRLAQLRGNSDPTRLAVLEQILYARGHSDAMRIYALDQLAAANPARCAQDLILYLPRFESSVLAHACDLAVTLGDVRVEDALIRSLDRAVERGASPSEIRRRSEWPALEKLAATPVPQTLYHALQTALDSSVRIAALDTLQTALPPAEVRAALAPMPNPRADAWLADLQWWSDTFSNLPLGVNENLWMVHLRRPEQANILAQAAARHRLLAGQPDYVFAARFVGTLAAIDDASLAMPRSDLLAAIREQLAGKAHVKREPAYKGSPEDVDESLPANEAKLSRCDLLAIRMLLKSLSDPAFIAQLHQQGLDDLSDTTTEHGGLLAFSTPAPPSLPVITPRLYPPLLAENDFEYLTGDQLLRDTPTGLAEYHFHFQQVRNAARAGPGEGDLKYAHAARCNGVVITSVDTRKFDVDYYTPSGAVLDLGVYEAPAQ